MTRAEYQRAYVQRHRERVRQFTRECRQRTQPWRRRSAKAASFASNSNRRARNQGIVGRLTATEVRRIDGPCVYCGGNAMGWDHAVPMWRGGTNSIENLVSCCWPCNLKKARQTSAEFMPGALA